MTVSEAKQFIDDFDETRTLTEEDIFLYTEALQYLIEETKNPQYMMQLGGYYYDQKDFDLALKYYEMAEGYDYDCAYECLGYIWYYGRTGKRDYEKAFYYFKKVMDTGNVVAAYKIADMYKNGYYVEKNQAKYEEIIENLYEQSRRWEIDGYDFSYLPLPEIDMRLAKIRTEQERIDEAVELYMEAKFVLARRLSLSPFFGNFNMMKWLIDDLYALIEFAADEFDFYDLYYLLNTPHKMRFYYNDEVYTVESVLEGEECEVCCNGKWYHNRDEFFLNFTIEETKATSIYEDFYGFEVVL